MLNSFFIFRRLQRLSPVVAGESLYFLSELINCKRRESKEIEGLVVLYFCLDTKVPKNQDLYKNSLGNRPPLLKFRNSLRSNSRNFFTQEKPVSTLRDGNFYKGRKLRKQGTFVSRSSFFLAFLEKDGPEDGKKSAYVKKSVLFERSEFNGF
jgi:hypothetical protein